MINREKKKGFPIKYKDIVRIKRRMDFNLTESEVLIRLIESANRKGESENKNNKRLKKIAKNFYENYKEIEKLIFEEDKLPKKYQPTKKCTIGIDGGHYIIGGTAGKWYVPFAVARIIFEKGLNSEPKMDIYTADIEEINEKSGHIKSISIDASVRMLIGEIKALDNWGSKNKESIIFIDGPVSDPPTYNDKDYIETRCKPIKKCLNKSFIIGCVKRSRSSIFLKYFEEKLGHTDERFQKDFITDQRFFAYIFTNYRFVNEYKGVLFSHYLNISDIGTHSYYKENGIHIFSLFYQKNIESKILRLDIPVLSKDIEKINLNFLSKAVKATAEWQYPKQHIPLPLELADYKSRIREGTAEILFDEIITKSRSYNYEDYITMLQLR